MSKGTTIRTTTIQFVNNTANPNTPIKQKINLPTDIDVFRIQIQAEVNGQILPLNFSGGPTPVPLIPYIAVNGQDDDNNVGMKLYVKPWSDGFTNYGALSVAASDILILDRRNTEPAKDELYLTAYNLPNAVPGNVLNANILFEGYI